MLLILILKKMIVCVHGEHMPGHTWRSEDNSLEWGLSSYLYLDSEDWAQAPC